MVFSSFEFLFRFLPFFLLIYYVTPQKWKNAVLFAGSILFYTAGEAEYVVLLLASVVINYVFGRLMYRDTYEGRGKKQLILLIVALCYDFGVLFLFKYSGFMDKLPLGISFYTFQIAAYIIDVYRGRVPVEKSFIRLGTYVTMFPQLIAGPIVRFQSVQAELKHRDITWEKTGEGAARFVCGLCKKVLIADSLATFVQTLQNISETAAKTEAVVTTGIRAEGAGIGTLGYWVLALAFMLQLYYDFSGYSDMAIGLGKILGFTFPENFRYPFISKSISEFWRRWHMTLGGWFRDYLYIPLGGNRVSVLRWCFNMFVVWLLSGLWHGAGWNFALWGLYFGVFLSAEKLIGKKWKERSFKIADISANNDSNGGNRKNMFLICARNSIEHGYVLLVVLVSFVIFRVESVREIKEQLLGLAGSYGNAMTPMVAYEIKSCLILLLIACAGATPFPAMWVQRLKNTNMWKKSGWLLQSCYILTGLVLATAFLLGSSVHPFLYFRSIF